MNISKKLVFLFLCIISISCIEAHTKKESMVNYYTEEVPVKCSKCGTWYYASSGHTCSK